MGAQQKGSVTIPSQTITFPVTLSLTDADNLLVSLTNAINKAALKGGKKGGGKGKGGGGKGKGGGK
jgi:hypothetical protein